MKPSGYEEGKIPPFALLCSANFSRINNQSVPSFPVLAFLSAPSASPPLSKAAWKSNLPPSTPSSTPRKNTRNRRRLTGFQSSPHDINVRETTTTVSRQVALCLSALQILWLPGQCSAAAGRECGMVTLRGRVTAASQKIGRLWHNY